ncbi:MAG TPA: type IV pilus assembly protein PilM [Acidimicrobiales bacterium]|nr:type IV pilus assembly protein PilM [Acidimicrobiales bacterium]
MARVTGLDIGTFAVRAVELDVGSGQPTLNRFGQVALAPGVVVDGEIVDTEAVGAAIRRLWREGGFRGKKVTFGIANQRVIVRQAELPAMSEADLVSALQFEAQELIPIPVEEAILDFQVLEQLPAVGAAEARVRILLAAAQRDMVRTHLAAVERGGLAASVVDVVPFALVRALTVGTSPSVLPDGAVDAIVNIGGGITNVVVHEQGVPRFVRVMLTGGDDITEAIAREMGVELDGAEEMTRRAAFGGADPQAVRIVAERLSFLVEEIRSSLEYYVAQPDALPLQRVLVTGGGSRTAGLVERLQQQLFAPVEVARPLSLVKVGAVGLSEDQLREAESLLTVPIGLALAGAPLGKGVRRITLLPREVTEAVEQRRQAILTGSAVAALALLLLLLWAWRGAAVDEERKRAQEAEEQAVVLERQVAALQDVTKADTEIAARDTAVKAVLTGEVAWVRVLNEVALVMPGDVWLTSFSGTSGGISVNAQGFDHTSTAHWIMRVGLLPSLNGLWVPSSNKGPGARSLVTFGSSAGFTDRARSDRYNQRFGQGQQ